MKKQIANKLTKALRSGAYDQTTGNLATEQLNGDTAFCCLGVLCELHAQEGLGVWKGSGEKLPKLKNSASKLKYAPEDAKTYYDMSAGFLPRDVAEWAGMSDDIGRIEVEGIQYPDSFSKKQKSYCDYTVTIPSLAVLNDQVGCNFDQIADFIELNWELL